MTSLRAYFAKVFSTGFVVLFILSLPLFWLRSNCERELRGTLDRSRLGVKVEPSGLVPDIFENDPNVVFHSEIAAGVPYEDDIPLASAGIRRALAGYPNSDFYVYVQNGNALYFDRKLGVIVYHDIRMTGHDGQLSRQTRTLYAGPFGVSEFPSKVGRFKDVIASRQLALLDKVWVLVVYDTKLRQFFRIDFDNTRVVKSDKLPKDGQHNPIQLGELENPGYYDMVLIWNCPLHSPRGEDNNPTRDRKPLFKMNHYRPGTTLFVLDKSGRVDRLDTQTLRLGSPAGYLPSPVTLFSRKKKAAPAELLAYRIQPIARFEDNEYLGLAATSVSRQGSAVALNVFDKDGNLVETGHSTVEIQSLRGATYRRASETSIYFDKRWSSTFTVEKFLLENLQSPILLIASYYTAGRVEALAGHKAIFILPNSFLAMYARGEYKPELRRFFSAPAFMLPAIILAILLTWRITVHAHKIGLPRKVTTLWQLATFAFGLTAYITYHLTKPRMMLVTCGNCGRSRRPDQENCHRCRSEWQVPELNPPSWRIKDSDAAETLATSEEDPLPAQAP